MIKDWSILTLPPRLKVVKIYFDTNFLLYLYSKDYPGVISAFEIINTHMLFEGKPLFVEMIASQYVLFEFFENRKKKHYKEFLIQQGIPLPQIDGEGDEVYNKYKKFNYFDVNGHNYIDIFPQIKELVENDIRSLEDYSIKHEEHVLNSRLFLPTMEFCLTSRVSRHDCLITSSAIYPNSDTINSQVFIWTNDKDFELGYQECNQINNIFAGCDIGIDYISSLKIISGGQINLLNAEDLNRIPEFIKQKIKEYFIQVNFGNFIGFTVQASTVVNVIYIENKNLNLKKRRVSLTIIGKDFDFIVSSGYIDEFWHNGEVIQEFPINTNDVISCKWQFPEAIERDSAEHLENIISELKKSGHLAFINDYYEEY